MSNFIKFARKRPVQPLSPADYYRRRRLNLQFRAQVQQGFLPTLDQIADPENLVQVYRELKQKAGHAPGMDGVTYQDLSPSEVGICMRGLAKVVQNDLYRPGPSLLVQIPKASGKGHRTLALRNILDRVISAALNKALTPLWETIFLPRSMGFRPGLGPWDMLLQVERTMVQQDRWILAIDDIKDAFDHVNLADLMDDHRRHIRDERLIVFIENNLRGGSKPQRKEGIEQGNAYSPTALNVRLYHAHDLALQQDQSNPPWFRYADNLAYSCQSVSQGFQVLQRSQSLLQPSFTLKGEQPPVDLREGQVQLLGFKLSYVDGQVKYGLGEGAWSGLKQNLKRAHEALNPPAYALWAVRGWIGAYGPALEGTWRSVIDTVLQIAASFGFRELGTLDLKKEWQSSYERWTIRRKTIGQPCL